MDCLNKMFSDIVVLYVLSLNRILCFLNWHISVQKILFRFAVDRPIRFVSDRFFFVLCRKAGQLSRLGRGKYNSNTDKNKIIVCRSYRLTLAKHEWKFVFNMPKCLFTISWMNPPKSNKHRIERKKTTSHKLCCIAFNLASAWSITIVIHCTFVAVTLVDVVAVVGTGATTFNPLYVWMWSDRAGQFGRYEMLLSVGVNSHAIRFQRLHYRGAPLVVGNVYVRFSH